MDRLSAFLAMGGYGGYIWTAYLVAVVVLAALLVASLRSVRKQEARLAALRHTRRGLTEDDI
jgi:heme exporter protein D